jgi:hypothetical protein
MGSVHSVDWPRWYPTQACRRPAQAPLPLCLPASALSEGARRRGAQATGLLGEHAAGISKAVVWGFVCGTAVAVSGGLRLVGRSSPTRCAGGRPPGRTRRRNLRCSRLGIRLRACRRHRSLRPASQSPFLPSSAPASPRSRLAAVAVSCRGKQRRGRSAIGDTDQKPAAWQPITPRFDYHEMIVPVDPQHASQKSFRGSKTTGTWMVDHKRGFVCRPPVREISSAVPA